MLIDSGTDGIDFSSSESGSSPVLTVVYKCNHPAVDTQPVSGTSAHVSFTDTLPPAQTYFWNVRVTDTPAARRLGAVGLRAHDRRRLA